LLPGAPSSILTPAAQLALTPRLEHLDVSFTDLHSLDFITLAIPTDAWSLVKVVLSGTKLRRHSLDRFLSHIASLPPAQRDALHTLKIGSMGLGRLEARLVSGGPAANVADLDALALAALLPVLLDLAGLRRLSLHGNYALDRRDLPLYRFFVDLAPRLTRIDLTGVKLSSSVLGGLFEGLTLVDEVRIEVLLLDNCHVDDDGLVALACCKRLRELHLAGSRVTGASAKAPSFQDQGHDLNTETGLGQLMEACPALSVLDLTGCRGVDVRVRPVDQNCSRTLSSIVMHRRGETFSGRTQRTACRHRRSRA
jgi:hypothetical protein